VAKKAFERPDHLTQRLTDNAALMALQAELQKENN
jgi:hypothetical protein